jgi:cobalt/nickel transport system permease protein
MHQLTRHMGSESSHPLALIDPRVKLLSALALLVMVISCRGVIFPLLVAAVSFGLCLTLRVPLRVLLLRFSEPLFIALMVFLLKLFFAGEVPLFSWDLGWFRLTAHRDGLAEGILISSRILGGVSLLGLVGFSTPFTGLMAALSWMRVPQALVDVALFAWRYLFLLMEDAQVVYHAQRNRLGYVGYRRGLSSLGTLAGVLVLKAFDNSQSVTTAMMQRGYDGAMPLLRHQPFKSAEVALALLLVLGLGWIRVIS